MQEKAWSTGGLKKLIEKYAITYKKASLVINTVRADNSFTIQFDNINTDEFFIFNNTKKWCIHAIYNSNNFVFKIISYNPIKSEKRIVNINDLILDVDISGLELNSNPIDYYNTVTINPTKVQCSEGDNIEVIYKNSIYAHYVVL